MKFYGNGSVYIPETRRFARFINGSCEITDSTGIEFLLSAGYEHDGELLNKQDNEKADPPKPRGRKPKE